MKRIVLIILFSLILGAFPILAQDVQTPESAAAWHEDLQALLTQIERLHPDPYRGTPQAEFDAFVSELDANIPTMTDDEIVVSLMQLVSNLVDGHSNLLPFLQGDQFTAYPLDFYQFTDGVYLVDAAPEYVDLVGARLVQIGETDVDVVADQVARLVPRDNDSGGRVLLPTIMMTAEVLLGLNVIDDADQPSFVLELPDGTQTMINPERIAAQEFFVYFPQHYRLPPKADVMSLSQIEQPFWLTMLDDGRTLYAQSNETVAIGGRVTQLRSALNDESVERLILDLRYNGGGDIAHSRTLLNLLNEYPRLKEPGNFIVLIGRNTFSAAVVFLLWMQADMMPVTIGEPTGGSPAMFENGRVFNLPNSELRIAISTRARQDVPVSDTRRWIEPDVLIELTSAEYFAGHDPVLEAAVAYVP